MRHLLVVVGLCGWLTGCAATPDVTLIPLPAEALISETIAIPDGVSPHEVAALPPGAKVALSHMTENHRSSVTGEVLHASPRGVALMNATHESRSMAGTPVLSKVPYVSRLFKNTGVGMERVPVYWVPIHRISTTEILAPPPEGYVAPQLAIDTNDGPIFERIGIDFDFNVDEETGVMTDTESFTIQRVPIHAARR